MNATTNLIKYTKTDMDLQNEHEKQLITMLIGDAEFKQKQHILTHTCSEMFLNN